jgi:hypothetical protein
MVALPHGAALTGLAVVSLGALIWTVNRVR